MDNQAPTVSISPVDGSVDISCDTIIELNFNEPVIHAGGDTLNGTSIKKMVIFRENSIAGFDVPFEASINPAKTEITIIPEELSYGQTYYFELPEGSISDTCGNILNNKQTSSFTTIEDYGAPDEFSRDNIDLFSDPSTGIYLIQTRKSDPKIITVLNSSGSLVFRSEKLFNKTCTINLCREIPGIYILWIDFPEENRFISFKIIKV